MPQQQIGICAEEEGVKFTLRKEPASESEVSHNTRSKRAQEHTGVSQIGECETKQTSSCGVACSSGRCGSQVSPTKEPHLTNLDPYLFGAGLFLLQFLCHNFSENGFDLSQDCRALTK